MKNIKILAVSCFVAILATSCGDKNDTSLSRASIKGDGYITNVKVKRLSQGNAGCKLTKKDGTTINLGAINGCLKISLNYQNPSNTEEGNMTCDPDTVGQQVYGDIKHMSSALIGKKNSHSAFNDYGVGNINPVNFDPYYGVFVNPGKDIKWIESDPANTLKVKVEEVPIHLRSSCSTEADTGIVTIDHIIPILLNDKKVPTIDDIGVLAGAKFSKLGIQVFSNGTGKDESKEYEARAYIMDLSDDGTNISVKKIHYMGGTNFKGSDHSSYYTPVNGYRFASNAIGRDNSDPNGPYAFWGVNADTGAGEIMTKDQSENTITY